MSGLKTWLVGNFSRAVFLFSCAFLTVWSPGTAICYLLVSAGGLGIKRIDWDHHGLKTAKNTPNSDFPTTGCFAWDIIQDLEMLCL